MATAPNTLSGIAAVNHEPGQNAPVESVRRLQDTSAQAPEELLKFVKSLFKVGEEERERDRAYYQRGVKNENYYTGNQWGFFSPRTGQWTARRATDRDPIYVYNDFRYYSDAITTQWVQSRTDLVIKPANRDNVHAQGAARAASDILDYYEDKILTEPFLQTEGKRGQFYGDMLRYSYWAPEGGYKVQRPVFEERPVKLAPDAFTCADCGGGGTVDKAGEGTCPSCGSPALVIEEVPEFRMPVPAGVEEYDAGDIVTESVPPLEVKFDRTGATFDDGLWVRRRRKVRRQIIQGLFPWFGKGKAGGSASDSDDPGLTLQKYLRQGVGNTQGFGGGPSSRGAGAQEPEMVTVDQWWFRPPMYADCPPVAKGVELANGSVIPAGETLANVFPTGFYVLCVNGEPIDFRDEDFRDHWQHTPFILVPSRPDGDGIEDLCEPQRQRNQTLSLIDIDNRHNAAPGRVVRSPFLKRSDISGKPGEVAVVTNAPTDMPLREITSPIERTGLPAQVLEFPNVLDAQMQKMSKAWSISTGAPDIAGIGGQNTATGAQLQSTNAQAQRAPELALRAYGNRRWAEQILKLYRKNCIEKRFVPADPKKKGGIEGRWFDGAAIDTDLIVGVRRRSWMPKNEMDRKADLLQALSIPGPSGVPILFDPMAPPEIKQLIVEYHQVEVDIDSFHEDVKMARLHLDVMKELSGQFGEQGAIDPTMAGQAISAMEPLAPDYEDLEVQRIFYVKWLKSAEGLEAKASNPVFFEAVRAKVNECKQGQVAVAQQEQVSAMEANAPQMELEAALQGLGGKGKQEAARGLKSDAEGE